MLNIKIFQTSSSYNIRIQQSYIAISTAPPDKFAASTHVSYISLKGLQNQSTVKIKSIFTLKTTSVTLNIGHQRTR